MKKIIGYIICILLFGISSRIESSTRIQPPLRTARGLYPIPRLEPDRPRLALALSGGWTRGVAHIGVLEELEANGLRPDAIAGVSIGAVIGGLYATGYTTQELA
ncbi:MAG: patatin-like phospholipase family protein, partial [Calditrichota bacterium]